MLQDTPTLLPGHPSPRHPSWIPPEHLLGRPLDADAREAQRLFPARIPAALAEAIAPDDPLDPLLRQFMPSGEELKEVPGFSPDPLEEEGFMQTPGLLRKYPGRALLLVTGACAVHCRFCFRRHRQESHAAPREEALAAIAADTTVREVILSGGDPLMLGDGALQELLSRLAALPHPRRVRLHTRIPVAWPERITPVLANLLTATRLAR